MVARRQLRGETWLSCYEDSLSEDVLHRIQVKERFGDGNVVKSMKKVIIPANIADTRVNIETDVVMCDLPQLLNKDAMKSAQVKLDFGSRNQVRIYIKWSLLYSYI